MTKENNGWISVEKKLPPIETDILGLCNVSGQQIILIVSREVGDGEFWFSPVGVNGVDTENVVDVTNWLPLSVLPTHNQPFNLKCALAGQGVIRKDENTDCPSYVIGKSYITDEYYLEISEGECVSMPLKSLQRDYVMWKEPK